MNTVGMETVRRFHELNHSAAKIVKSRHPEPWRRTLTGIKTRCNNHNSAIWKYYGGKGVRCLLTLSEVRSMWARDAAQAMRRPSIDRIDPSGHYEVANCRFIEQAENSRRARLDENRNSN